MRGRGPDLFLQMVKQAQSRLSDRTQSPGSRGPGRCLGRAIVSLFIPDAS